MNQNKTERYKEKDMALLDKLDSLIESAELESQRTVTMLNLHTSVEQAYQGSVVILEKIENIASEIMQEEVKELAMERIELYKISFNEVINQLQTKLEAKQL